MFSVSVYVGLSFLVSLLLLLQQICHRDLKLENTLLDGSPAPRLKICDFGYSKVNISLVLYNSFYVFSS